jgi:hypothetical protein
MINQPDPTTDAIHLRDRVERMYRNWKLSKVTSEFVKMVYKSCPESQAIFKELRENDERYQLAKETSL